MRLIVKGSASLILLCFLRPTAVLSFAHAYSQRRQAYSVYVSNKGPRGNRVQFPLPPGKEFIVESGWELGANILKFTLRQSITQDAHHGPSMFTGRF
jgi:hypothetical protein